MPFRYASSALLAAEAVVEKPNAGIREPPKAEEGRGSADAGRGMPELEPPADADAGAGKCEVRRGGCDMMIVVTTVIRPYKGLLRRWNMEPLLQAKRRGCDLHLRVLLICGSPMRVESRVASFFFHLQRFFLYCEQKLVKVSH